MDEIDRLLSRVKQRAQGWMPLAVYRRLYDSAAACGGGTIVEIGTFRGAATIALALGARSAETDFRIVTADLLRPDCGLEGDSVEQKRAALGRTLEEFGVEHRVRFIHGPAASVVAEADPRDIRLLLLDGGGSIEEDFAQLWDRLAPAAAIVIDDIDGRISVQRVRGAALANQKHRISKLLAERFTAAGMLVEEARVESTGWYRKGRAAPAPDEIRLMALPAYRQIVRLTVEAREFGVARTLARRMAARAPALRRIYRRLRPAR